MSLLEEKKVKKSTTKVKKESKDCSICANKYNQTFRKPLVCIYCKFEVCNYCCRQFILSKTVPQCMNCKTVWSDDMLFSAFPKTWVDNDLRDHLDDVLVQHEKSLFPLAVEQIEKDKMEEERRRTQMQRVSLERVIDRTQMQIIKYKDRIHTLSSSDRMLYDSIVNTQKQNEKQYQDILAKEIEISEKLGKPMSSKYKRPCPEESCKGYINIVPPEEAVSDSENSSIIMCNCSVCNNNFCSMCRVKVKDANELEKHKCDINTIKSLKMIEKDSKQCPGCKVVIFKISGCNQIFCTNCKIAFNWDTLEIETGRIHNPHYFEWLAHTQQTPEQHQNQNQQNRYTMEDGCGNVIQNWMEKMSEILDKYYPKVKIENNENEIQVYSVIECRQLVNNIYRVINHMRQIELTEIPDVTVRHLRNRIQYVRNHIHEDMWKKQISTDERSYKTKFLWNQVVEMFITVATDIFHKFWNTQSELEFVEYSITDECGNLQVKKVPVMYVEMNNLRNYFNELSRKFSLRFEKMNYLYINSSMTTKYKTCVKEECPVENFDSLDLKNIKVYDWMDSVEKEFIEYCLKKRDIYDKLKVLLEIKKGSTNIPEIESKVEEIKKLLKEYYSDDMNDKLQLITEKIKVRSGRKIRTIVLTTGYDMLIQYTLMITEMCSNSFYFLDINKHFIDKDKLSSVDINKKVKDESIINMLNNYMIDYRFTNVLELDNMYEDFKFSYNLSSILVNFLFYNNNYNISNYRPFCSSVHKIMNNNIYRNDTTIYYYCYAKEKDSDNYVELTYIDCCLLGFMNNLLSTNSQEMNMLVVCQLWNNLVKGGNYGLLTKKDPLNRKVYNLNVTNVIYELFQSKFDSLCKTFTSKQSSMKNVVNQLSRLLRLITKVSF
jgi:hypothetical protein